MKVRITYQDGEFRTIWTGTLISVILSRNPLAFIDDDTNKRVDLVVRSGILIVEEL